MKKSKLIVTVVFTFFCVVISFAQSDSTKKSFFKLTSNYLSNSVYDGRKDSATVPYLRSSIGYFDKSGFFISSGISLLIKSNEPKRIDLVDLEAGYNFSINKLDAGIAASKFFYNNASFAVGSELKEIIAAYLGYNLGPVSLNAGGDLLFSTNTDYHASLGLSHAFETGEENNKWTIAPSAVMNAGTQYFNEAYYEFRKFSFTTTAAAASSGNSGSSNSSGKGRGHSNSSNSTTTTTVKTVTFYDKNKFTILDYEFSVPVNYDAKHWGLFANPVIAVPTNAASYAIDNAIQKEKISTSFFTEIGAYIKF
jgi:hypothetical protein